jgi:hypothetical protein
MRQTQLGALKRGHDASKVPALEAVKTDEHTAEATPEAPA